jgi:hypothetical protein
MARIGKQDVAKVSADCIMREIYPDIYNFKAPLGVRDPSKPSKLKPLDFGSAANINWDVLVAERERHETDEAKSAVTYRYKQAEAADIIKAVSTTLEDNGAQKNVDIKANATLETDAATSSKLKASVVTEITRVISASLTSTAKPDATGIERRVRWRGLGILGNDDTIDTAETPAMHELELASSARHIYDALSRRLHLPFVNGRIHSHPLKTGSWVLVGFQDKVRLGTGQWDICTVELDWNLILFS